MQPPAVACHCRLPLVCDIVTLSCVDVPVVRTSFARQLAIKDPQQWMLNIFKDTFEEVYVRAGATAEPAVRYVHVHHEGYSKP